MKASVSDIIDIEYDATDDDPLSAFCTKGSVSLKRSGLHIIWLEARTLILVLQRKNFSVQRMFAIESSRIQALYASRCNKQEKTLA